MAANSFLDSLPLLNLHNSYKAKEARDSIFLKDDCKMHPRRENEETHGWWALSDLNGRPFGCKPNALTAELSAQLNDRTGSGAKRQRAGERAGESG